MRVTTGQQQPPADHRHRYVLSLTDAEIEALGMDAYLLMDWFASTLSALATLRSAAPDSPSVTSDEWDHYINDTERRLAPRLRGVRDALIRAHHASGGSLGDLALAMDVPRSTAQSRRNAVLRRDPSIWEQWATGTLPTPNS